VKFEAFLRIIGKNTFFNMTPNTKITVTLSSEHRLEQALKQAGVEDPATVTHLIVAGMLTDVDFGYIRENMSETLHELDICNASIEAVKIPRSALQQYIVEIEQMFEDAESDKIVAVKNNNWELVAKIRDLKKDLEQAKVKWEQDLSENRVVASNENVAELVAIMTGVSVQRVAHTENPFFLPQNWKQELSEIKECAEYTFEEWKNHVDNLRKNK